jgi:hypothetical protein
MSPSHWEGLGEGLGEGVVTANTQMKIPCGLEARKKGSYFSFVATPSPQPRGANPLVGQLQEVKLSGTK